MEENFGDMKLLAYVDEGGDYNFEFIGHDHRFMLCIEPGKSVYYIFVDRDFTDDMTLRFMNEGQIKMLIEAVGKIGG